MLLREFLRKLGSDDEREAFAARCGTKASYMRRCAYESKVRLKPSICVRIEADTKGEVTRQELRDDWREIWPELAEATEGA